MSIGLTAAVKILEMAISMIEGAIGSYNASTGTDLISELETHFGKLAMIISAAKAAVPAVEAAVGVSGSTPSSVGSSSSTPSAS